MAQTYGLGLTVGLLDAAVADGVLAPLPTTALAHVLIGALQEAALLVAAEPASRADAGRVVHRLVDGLADAT